MADITDADAIQYSNEVVRTMADRLVSLKSDIDRYLSRWYLGINAATPNDTSPLADERMGRALSLTGANINSFVAQMAAIQTLMDASGVMDVISKPAVNFR